MANNNFPHGFRPLMVDITGEPVGANQYAKAASDANAIFTWDLVKGAETSASVDGELIPSKGVSVAASGNVFLGSSLNYGAPSTATLHLVVDDPLALYEAQCDDVTSVTVAGSAGKNANIVATAQTNGTLLSAMQVDTSTIATTNTLDLHIRDLYRNISNFEGANAIVEVIINRHQYANQVAGN